MASLLLGCGNDHSKRIKNSPDDDWSQPLVKMDMDPNCGADIVWDLEKRPLPFNDDTFDEIGAFDVLEHWGRQGDWRGYFDEFAEYWRILKPDGRMYIIVPIGGDALADIGHTRFFSVDNFKFLSQRWYDEAIASRQNVTDYRWYWKHDFAIEHIQKHEGHHISVVLRKVVA